MKIRVLMVEPEKEPRVECIENTLEAMQEVVGGYIQFTQPPTHDDDAVIVCNEEGKLYGLEPNAFLCYEDGTPYDVVCGTFFICDGPYYCEDFQSLTDEQIDKYCQMYAMAHSVRF